MKDCVAGKHTTDPQRGTYLQYREPGGTKSSEPQSTAEEYCVLHEKHNLQKSSE